MDVVDREQQRLFGGVVRREQVEPVQRGEATVGAGAVVERCRAEQPRSGSGGAGQQPLASELRRGAYRRLEQLPDHPE